MVTILPYIQIVLAVLLITVILLQQSEAGLGAAFGGSGDAGFKHTRRGFEKILFNSAIIIGILFVVASFLALII